MIKSLNEFHNRRGVKSYYCKCGCGEIAIRSSAQPTSDTYIKNHKPKNFCKCGCGEIVKNNSKWIKEKISFICGCGCSNVGFVSHYYKRNINFIRGHNKNNPSEGIKKYLVSLSAEELSARSKKSLGSCDQEKRGDAIRKGKASILEVTFINGNKIIFSSIDSIKTVGIDYGRIKYIMKKHNGIIKENKMQLKYIFKYGAK
jgi:hypothetical protein